MIRVHTITVPPIVLDFILLFPLLHRLTRRLRKKIAHARRWL